MLHCAAQPALPTVRAYIAVPFVNVYMSSGSVSHSTKLDGAA
jgi:hypothetical protein